MNESDTITARSSDVPDDKIIADALLDVTARLERLVGRLEAYAESPETSHD